MTALAIELHRQGAEPTILSARWGSSWPSRVTHRQLPVVRLASAPRGGWNTLRYLRDVSRWLRKHENSFDVVYVGNLRYEAYTAVTALKDRGLPIVLRPEAMGAHGDCRWQAETQLGRRVLRRCQTADAIVAPSQSSERELLSAGYAAGQIARISEGAQVLGMRTAKSRYQSRLALGEANHDLAVADFAPVAVCVERLEVDRKLDELVAVWQSIADQWPCAKLWIIGDGTDRSRLYEMIVDRQLHHQIFLPGSFDELDEIFQAVDLYVSPTGIPTSTSLAAMAAGLPVVTVATGDNHAMMDSGVHGLLVPAGDVAALRGAIGQLLENPLLGMRLGEAARHRVVERFSLTSVAGEHLALFSRLTSQRRRGTR